MLRAWTLRAFLAHILIALLPLALLPRLYGSAGTSPVADAILYFRYASQAVGGATPYRDYPVEYPPLALVLFVIPRLFTSQLGLYVALFGLQMLLFDAFMLYLVVGRVAERAGLSQVPARLGWYTLFIAALYPFIVVRYDVAAAAVAFAAALWWFSRRHRLGGTTTALGALLKLFPACIAGPAFLWELSRVQTTRLRGTTAFGLTLAAGGAIWWALGGESTFVYHLERGLQIESVPSGLLMAIGKLTGGALKAEYNHLSYTLVAPGASVAAALTLPCQAGALVLVMWQFWRTQLQDPLRYAGAAILAFLICGKILSPQYLLWVIPFVTTLEGRAGHRARWIFLLGCIATTLVFPLEWGRLLAFDPVVIGVLNARSAALVGLLAVWLFDHEPHPPLTVPPPLKVREDGTSPDRPRGGRQIL